MTYTVIWKLSASQEVARVEAAADDPARVKAASARVDFMLRRYPRDMGESRGPAVPRPDPEFRIWYEDVLGVFFRVDEAAMRVEVLYAGPARRR